MNTILLNIADPRLSIRLTQTLLHLLWEGTVIGIGAFAMTRIYRTATARTRYGIHAGALALMALSVPCTFAWIEPTDSQPSGSVGTSTVRPASTATKTAPDRRDLAPGTETALTGEPGQSQTRSADRDGFRAAGLDSQQRGQLVDAPGVTIIGPRLSELVRLAAPYATGAYLLGLVAMLARLCCALWGGHRLRRCAVALGDRELLSQIRLQARKIGLAVTPVVAYCERIAIPVVAGILRPMILLPAGVDAQLDPEQLLVILAHEMAHIRRFDLLVNLLQRVLETILFFHPAVWYLSRQLSVERENCCDDMVVRAGNECTRYASALIRMAELCASSRRPVRANELSALAANGDGGGQLRQRILRLLDGEPRPRLTRTDALALALMVALIAVTGAGVWRRASAASAKVSEPDAAAAFRVQGRVVGPDGNPVAGAKVTIRRLQRDRWRTLVARAKQLAQVTTNADGRYEYLIPADELPKPHLGHFDHAAEWIQVAVKYQGYGIDPGYGIDIKNFASFGPGQTFDLQLAPETPVQGRILNLEGRPVAGVQVRVMEIVKLSKPILDAWHAAASRRQGQNLDEKKLMEERMFQRMRSGPGEAADVPADVVFHKGGLSNMRVLPDELGTVTTDAEGKFELHRLGNDRLVTLELNGRNLARSLVHVVTRPFAPVRDYYDGSVQTFHGSKFDYVVGPSAVVEGVVRDAETKRPLVGALVATMQVATDVHLHVPGSKRQFDPDGFITAVTDSAGRYRIEGLPPVEGNTIYVFPPENEPYLVKGDINVPPSTGLQPVTLDVDLYRGVWATGRVYDTATNKPVKASIDYSPFWTNPFLETYPQITGDGVAFPNNERAYSTDAEGRFRIVVVPGRGVLAAKVPDAGYIAGHGQEAIPEFASVTARDKRSSYTDITCDQLVPSEYHSLREIEPTATAKSIEVDLPLDPGVSVKFSFVDPEGQPVHGVAVSSLGSSSIGTIVDSQSVTLSGFARGKPIVVIFSNEGLVSSSGFVAGSKRNRVLSGVVSLTPQTNRETVTVSLQPLAKVRGRLVDSGGKPWPARRIQVTYKTDGGQTHGPYTDGTSFPFPDRSFELELRPGCAYRLTADGDATVNYRQVVVAENVNPQPGEEINLGDLNVPDNKPEDQ